MISTTFRARRAWLVALVATTLVAISVVWGWVVQRDPDVKLGAAPLVGHWQARIGLEVLPAFALAVAVIWKGADVVRRLSFAGVVMASAATGTVFALLLAACDGWPHVLAPVVHPTEYWANLATLPDASTMLHRYGSMQFLVNYSVHAKGHPPGFLLLLKGLASLGLGHPWVAGALSYLGIAVVATACLLTVRIVAGEEPARRLAPFVVLVPYAVWMGTSADAFYAGVGALVVLLSVVAVTADPARRTIVAGLAAGTTLGLLAMLTYGAVIFGLLVSTVVTVLGWRRWRQLARVGASVLLGVTAVMLAFRLAGFWWFDGLRLTRSLYWAGTAQFRPAGYFLVADLGAAIIAVGPAVVFGIGGLRDRRVWVLVAAAILCIVAADASQYSKAEVERIWLMFFPWLLPSVTALPRARIWLAAQAALALGLQLTLVSKW